ncbi:MAG: hypothetical protein LBC72_00305 [Spirochaetaceae bacterium]|nr:hypothetical protein [Spirochaetaceae bacterium]
MKNKCVAGWFLLVRIFAFGQDESVSVESLKGKYNFQYVVDTDYGLKQFKEIGFGLMTYEEEMKTPVLLCATEKGKVICIYGAILGDSKNRYIMYDLDGDGILEYRTSTKNNYIPNWILFKANSIKRNNNIKDFLQICDAIYGEFNQEAGPNKQKMAENLKALAETVDNQKANNRDIYYSLLVYNLFSSNPDMALKIVYTLQKYVANKNKGNVPLLLYLYFAETLNAMGDEETALQAFKGLKQMDSNSTVADYYIARIEDKLGKTGENMKKFKQKHPDFWMAK